MANGLEQRLIDRVIATAREAGVDIRPDVMAIVSKHEYATIAAVAFPLWLAAHPDVDPDVGCCMGSAVYGPERCTCWEDVYDVEQTDPILPVPEGSIQTRGSRCGDCAFRKDSPERADKVMEEELLDLALTGTPFWCHDGMRRPVAYRHPTFGDVSASDADWRPPMIAGVPFRRDGSPGLLCAGWTQEVRRVERTA